MLANSLFIGFGLGGIYHYRSKLPANALGSDLISVTDQGQLLYDSTKREWEENDVVIIQMPAQDWSFTTIRDLTMKGVKVLANVDDYLFSVRKLGDKHFNSGFFDKKLLNKHEACLNLVDGICVSTPWLARKMRKYNSNVYLCPNGLDLNRYRIPEVERDTGSVIGWSGGTGHSGSMGIIAPSILRCLEEFNDTIFISVGDDFTKMIDPDGKFKERVHNIPWGDLYTYPEVMGIFDIALGPAESNNFYRAKSQLRFYEAGAVKSCPVMSPHYDEIVHEETGYICESPSDWTTTLLSLCEHRDESDRVSENAHKYVTENCSIESRIVDWEYAINDIMCVS